MDRRDAESFGRSFSEISRIKDLLPSAKSHDHRNDLLVELQEHYGTVIFFDPLLSLERKFEVELWNIVFKEPISACFEGLRKHSSASSTAFEYQKRLINIIDRGVGFYYTLMHKLLERLQNSAWTENVLESSLSLNVPANRLTNFGGGRYDLDACTLRLQSARFSRKENSLLKITTKLVSDFEKSIQRPIILPRGAKLPDREDIPVKSNQFKEDSPLSLKIGISQAIIYLVQYCCIHLGDLVRYQRQQNVATSFYITACHIDPTCGHAYNQMGLIEASKPDRRFDSLCSFYVRALGCSFPFLFAKNNLKMTMNTVLESTKKEFENLLMSPSVEKDLCEFLMFPLLMLIRFHSVASNNKDPWSVTKAASEFVTATKALTLIVGEAGDSVDLPGPLSERVADLAADFVKIKPGPDHLKNLHNLQIRFLNAIVLHSFGLQTNWFNEDNSFLRQCLLYSTVWLINWFCASALAIRSKCSPVESDLPVMPILLASLTLSAQCSPQKEGNANLTDSEILEFAPSLSTSSVALLNSLTKSATLAQAKESVLQDFALPELFALQGFLPMGIPVFEKSYQPGPFIDLMPGSFFDGDSNLQATYFNNRVSLLVNTFRSVAADLPNLVKWSELEHTFVHVNRVDPSLPKPPDPFETQSEANRSSNSPSRTSVKQPDFRNGELENSCDGVKKINNVAPNIEATVGAMESHSINGNAGAPTSSSKPVPLSSTYSINDINTTELARFIQEQSSQLAARQRRQQEEEAAKLKATSSHRYSASRSNFQRELSPQSHDSDVTKSISPENPSTFEVNLSDRKQFDEHSSNLFTRSSDRVAVQGIRQMTVANGTISPIIDPLMFPPHLLAMPPPPAVMSHRWRFVPPPPHPAFARPGVWPRHFAHLPPPPPALGLPPVSYLTMPTQRPLLFNGNSQESPHYMQQNGATGNYDQDSPNSAFT